MAEERNLELLDDYLTNRMSAKDRSAFEYKLKADPDLQHEYAMQKRLIQGLKEARIAELKSMLNQVPVPSHGSGNAVGSKVLIGTVVSLMIAAAAYWFLRDEPATVVEKPAGRTEQQAPAEVPATPQSDIENSAAQQKQAIKKPQVVETDKNQTSAGTEHSKPSLAKKPDPLSAPEAKDSEKSGATDGVSENGLESAASVVVEQNNERSFHYNNQHGKITLYGPFDKDGYDVIELKNSEKKSSFLYYQDKYYLLEEGVEIRSLAPVTDPALLKELQDQRN